MSNSFEVLIDHEASAEDAAAVGKSIIDALVAERIILPETNSDCILGGVGHPPGPRVREIYGLGKQELPYWDQVTNGVKLITERYVNFFAFPVFEHSQCPSCGGRFPGEHAIMDALYDCVCGFINEDRLESMTCPSCSTKVRCDQWITQPALGFCHLALEFWNWPTFDSGGWKLSIPELIRGHTGRNLTHSWGRM